ncbi:MAG TPA: vWA domain-containing protein [Polyangiales bacterium]
MGVGLAGALVCAGGALSGCGLVAKGKAIKEDLEDLPDEIPDIEDSDALKAQAVRLLELLFPDLSRDELLEISASLSLEALLDLREELSAARAAAAVFADGLYTSAKERVKQRQEDLASHNDGFPAGLAAIAPLCTYDAESARARVHLNGVLDGKEAVKLTAEQVRLTVDGAAQPFELSCLHDGPSVDIVFLVDITGSMRDVIHAVRDSVVRFVDALEAGGVRGTVSVVSFQDTVGVNRTFQQPAPAQGYERSPFFAPVSLDDPTQVDELRAFVNRLEANRGADAPENLAAALDFARNSVIGYAADGAPNVIGDGKGDPVGTEPFPVLESDKQVFVVLTDVTFHGDDRTETNSSLLRPFVPRDAAEILSTLQRTGTTVHVSDPSWVDEPLTPESERAVDADYWAMHTGGVGEDKVVGYSLVDLDLLVVAKDAGLFDITLDKIIASSCSLEFSGQLAASASVRVELDVAGKQFASTLQVLRR